MRQVLGVVTGFVLWSILWLSLNQVLLMLGVLSPPTAQPLTNAKPLLLLLAGSAIISVASGYATAAIAGARWATPVLALGVLLLLTGIFVETRLWHVIPLWYHITFLGLLIPMSFLGGRMQAGSPDRA
jgi:hypothetical protein